MACWPPMPGKGACVLVKGLRNATDFDQEYQMASINRGICPGLETVFLPASPAYQHFSSTMVREMIRYGQPMEQYAGPGGRAVEKDGHKWKTKNVQKLLDMLFGMIDEAKGATFSSEKCVINRDEALDLLDEIRNKLPGELTKAQELMKSKEQYVDKANHEVRRMLDQAQDEAKRLREQAQAEAKRMLEKAQEDAKTIVSESETIQRAQRRSSEIIRQAEDRSRQLYQVANTYTEDALRRTEEAIQAALDEVRESRVRYRSASAEQMQACQEKLKADPVKPLLRGVTNFPVHFCAFR